jgi:hypothetical protein
MELSCSRPRMRSVLRKATLDHLRDLTNLDLDFLQGGRSQLETHPSFGQDVLEHRVGENAGPVGFVSGEPEG